jgi:hypothetical protein
MGASLARASWSQFIFWGGNAMKLLHRQFLYLAAGAAALPAMSRIAMAQSGQTHVLQTI